MSTQILSQKTLKELLHYNPDSGIFTWKHRHESMFGSFRIFRSWNAKHEGKEAGYHHENHGNVYMETKISLSTYKLHRLAWLYIYGEFPECDIDHINGNGLDNRISNLRDVKGNSNAKNQRLYVSNKSGIHGVIFVKDRRQWRSMIRVNRKLYYLGETPDFFEACCARKSAENKYGFFPNHGRR